MAVLFAIEVESNALSDPIEALNMERIEVSNRGFRLRIDRAALVNACAAQRSVASPYSNT